MTVETMIVSATIAVAYIALGAIVLVASPRARANRAFAAYGVGSGLYGSSGLWMGPLGLPLYLEHVLFAVFYLGIAAAVVMLAAAFPERVRGEERKTAKVAVLVALLLLAVYSFWLAPGILEGFHGWASLPLVALGVGMSVTSASTAFFAVRAARAPHLLPSYSVMAIAVFLPLGIASGSALGTTPWLSLFGALNVLVAALAWIVTAVRVASKRWPVAVAWVVLGSALAAQIASPVNGGRTAGWDATVAAVKVVAIAPLAFKILRGQVPGLETKVRWTVSRSTVAAAFVAVFFVASEGAQILFGQGNEWIGLFAAGSLVFAIAPLQRAAERLAEKAVPEGPARPTATPGVDSFRRAVRFALKDRRLTHDEELDLATVAHDLGLTVPDATRIRLEVEREIRTGGDAASYAVRLALRDSVLTRDDEVRLHELAEQLGIGAGRAHALLLRVEREGASSVPTKTQEGRA